MRRPAGRFGPRVIGCGLAILAGGWTASAAAQVEEPPAQVVDSEVPLASMFGYVSNLRSMTQGRATYTMQFSHYAQAPESVAEEFSYR